MKRLLLFFICLLFLLILGVHNITAQVTFVQPDPNNLGLSAPGGLMGFAWGDIDADGDLDFIICGAPSVLYRNDVNEGGGFVQISADAAGTDAVFLDNGGNGANTADINGDGKLDLILGSMRIFLSSDTSSTGLYFANQYLTTTDVSNTWGNTAADYDKDGDVDIAIAAGTESTNGAGPLRIFQNDGTGNFTDVGDAIAGSFSFESWNPSWIDYDNDGNIDLWIPDIRTAEPCALFKSNGSELEYQDPAATGIPALSAIVSSWADYNNDGYLDVWLMPLFNDAADPAPAYNNVQLYQNNGDGTFTNVAPTIGLDSIYATANTARGVSWGDYDNDGWKDLLMGRRGEYPPSLWRNNTDGTFSEVGVDAGITFVGSDLRSITFVDYDNDGWLDIYWKQNGGGVPMLMHNEGGNSNHWLAIRPKGAAPNTAAIGARVEVYAGGMMQMRYVQAGDASGGTNGMLFPHFGLGSSTTADSIVIKWPAGGSQTLTNVAADRYLDIEEGVVSVEPGYNPAGYALLQNYPNPFNPSTSISFNLPQRNKVRLVLVDILGKEVMNISSGEYEAGLHTVKFNAANLASGIYFYKLEAGDYTSTKKLVLMK